MSVPVHYSTIMGHMPRDKWHWAVPEYPSFFLVGTKMIFAQTDSSGESVSLYTDRAAVATGLPAVIWFRDDTVRVYNRRSTIFSKETKDFLQKHLRIKCLRSQGATRIFRFSCHDYLVHFDDYLEFTLRELLQGYLDVDSDWYDGVRAKAVWCRDKVFEPMNKLVVGRSFRIPMGDGELFGNRQMEIGFHNQLPPFKITADSYEKIILTYNLHLQVPILLEDQQAIEDGLRPFYVSQIDEEACCIWSVVAINSFSVFQILREYFGGVILPTVKHLEYIPNKRLYRLGRNIYLAFDVETKVSWSVTSALFK